jgi:hypothetical protein
MIGYLEDELELLVIAGVDEVDAFKDTAVPTRGERLSSTKGNIETHASFHLSCMMRLLLGLTRGREA